LETNVAIGLASIGGVAGANAQTNKQHQEQGKEITHNKHLNQIQSCKSILGRRYINDSPRTICQLLAPDRVTDGKTGKSAVYVYHNNKPGDANFDVKR
jgi:hypothetical protein